MSELDRGECLYLAGGQYLGRIQARHLESFNERHQADLARPQLDASTGLDGAIVSDGCRGIVIELNDGWPSFNVYRLARRALRSKKRVWFYWPRESAIESVDSERLGSYFRQMLFVRMALRARRFLRPLKGVVGSRLFPGWPRPGDEVDSRFTPRPVRFNARIADGRIQGTGVYMRTDFWAKISSGGSYGHTCYLAKAIRKISDNLVCFMPQRYELLDEIGLRQIVIDQPFEYSNEEAIIAASDYYYRSLKAAFQLYEPAFIYERLCLGNTAGARLSSELQIPYIVEYNGSEASMLRSFDGTSYRHEQTYLEREMQAFRQATLISVVSSVIMDTLVARGVDARKILVNPNGVDLDAYTPPANEEKTRLRSRFGWHDGHVVIGFIGTFGGWHGIDVLASAMPMICESCPDVRWLIVGDGKLRHLIEAAMTQGGIGDRVFLAGRVPQREGATLLGACDIYVSPHSSHMVDSRFFGSPTKVFEYMAMAGGIVASDLEQIGEVLSPALRVADLARGDAIVSNQRAVLCTPGDVKEFAAAVAGLSRRPDIARELGRNSRRAAAEEFSWDAHASRLVRKLCQMEG